MNEGLYILFGSALAEIFGNPLIVALVLSVFTFMFWYDIVDYPFNFAFVLAFLPTVGASILLGVNVYWFWGVYLILTAAIVTSNLSSLFNK